MAYLYWASQEPGLAAKEAAGRLEASVTEMRLDGRLRLIRKSLAAYYGRGADGGGSSAAPTSAGDVGELTRLTVNLHRPLVERVLGVIAGTRLNVAPRATNTDAGPMAQTRLAASLLETYDNVLDMATTELDTVRNGLVALSWNMVDEWRPTAGRQVGEEAVAQSETDGLDDFRVRPTYEGDIIRHLVAPWRIAYDTTPNPKHRKWMVYRYPRAVADLCAEYPDAEAAILESVKGSPLAQRDWGAKVAGVSSDVDAFSGWDGRLFGESLTPDETWVMELRHLPCIAYPEGRLLRWVGEDGVLVDTPYPYQRETLHAHEYAVQRVAGTSKGWSGVVDALGLSDMVDSVWSAIVSDVDHHSQLRWWTASMSGVTPHSLENGVDIIESPTQPVLMDTPPFKVELLQVADALETKANNTQALNEAVMGEPPKGMPAQGMAFLRAQTTQYHQAAVQAYAALREFSATSVLRMLKQFAKESRVTNIAGQSDTYEVREWKAADIGDVAGFQVEKREVSQTSFEAKTALAEMLMQLPTADGKPIMTPQGLITVLQTGQLKEPLEATTAQTELITSIKGLLRQGIGLAPIDEVATQMAQEEAVAAGVDPSTVLPVFMPAQGQAVTLHRLDPHWRAIPEYLAVLASPASRENGAVVTAVTDVVRLSLQMWASLSPDELAAVGGPPLPSQLGASAPMPGDDAGGGGPKAPGLSSESKDPKLPAPPPEPDGTRRDAAETSLEGA